MVPLQPVLTQQLRAQQLTTVQHPAVYSKIGGIGPTTGGAAVYGLAVQHGAEIAVEEINAAGGINGYQVEFKFQDDEADAEKSVNAYNALKDLGRTGPRRIYHQWSMYCGYRQDQRRQYVPDHSFRICSRMCSV